MSDKDRVIEGKEERQKTMDKLSVKSGRAHTYDPNKGEAPNAAVARTTPISSNRKQAPVNF